MIDETLLADPTRCPECGAALTAARDVCPSCALPLTGATAGRLWQVSVQAAELLGTRRVLLADLRAAPAPSQPAPGTGPAVPTAGPASPEQLRAPRPEWSLRRVQNLLLALGVGLLGVAAVIFVAVSWDRLGVGGRSAVMAGVTAVAALGAHRAHRRGLLSTAEWLSLLTVGLAVLDAYGARASDLAGLAAADTAAYWAGALAVVAVLVGLLALAVPTRTLPPAAAVLAQLPVPLLCAHLVDDVDHPFALVAVLLAAQVAVALALVAAWPSGDRTRDARGALAVGGLVALLYATGVAAAAAYAEDGSLVVGAGVLLLLAGVLAAGGGLAARRPPGGREVGLADGAAAVLVVLALWAPARAFEVSRWQPPYLGAVVLALLVAAWFVPFGRRAVPAWVVVAAGVVPALATTAGVSAAAEQMLAPLERPWALTAEGAVAGTAAGADGTAMVHVALVLSLLATVAALLGGALVLRRPLLRVAAVPVGSVAAALVAPALGAPYAVQLTALVLLAALLLAAGALLDARGFVVLGWSGLASGAVALLLAGSWSLALPEATLAALPGLVAAALVGAVAARGSEALRPWRVVLVTAALVLTVAEVAAAARHGGAGWAAVWSLSLALAAATAVACGLWVASRSAVTDAFWAPLHTTAAVVATVSTVSLAGAVAAWREVSLAGCGLAAACAAGALLAGAAAPWPTRRPARGAVQVAAAAAAVPAVLLAGFDAERLWVALLVVGLGLAVVATTPARHRLGWVAGLVLAASSWVRLALSDVDAPEAYTVPGGVALLVVGALRRRRDPEYGSWQAYGSGLSLALVPSLLRAVTDAGDLRPLLLAAVAAAVLAVGAVRRLQAPLVLGAVVLSVDALVQLAPYLAAAYDVAPRWATLGTLGLLLLGAGATYERRVRDLRRVRRHVARLG